MSRWVAALDLGGTDLKFCRVAEDGAASAFRRMPSRVAESERAPLEAIVAAIEALRAEAPIEAVGLGVPGVVDPATGTQVGRTAHLVHWDGLPVRERVEALAGLPVEVDNDANLAALAEHEVGAARGTRCSITVTVGTGVGCGIVEAGRLVRGAFGGAGELGHIPAGSGELECRCGVARCLEPEISGSGLVRLAAARGLACRDAADVFVFAAKGELRARELVARFADRLGMALAVAVQLLNPEVVVIGGGVARAGEALLTPVRASVERHVLTSHLRGLRVVPAALGERAGTIGAGLIAWRRLAARL